MRWLFFVLLAGLLSACARTHEPLRLEGRTMGTSWHITVGGPVSARLDATGLRATIDRELQAINDSMSTYQADSEISRFNAAAIAEPFVVSQRFAQVLEAALAVGAASGGAYDVSVGPLVELWGFGASGGRDTLPDDAAVERTRAGVGVQYLQWNPATRALAKLRAVSLDFSSIAKGYAVDQLAMILEAAGAVDYLVEIGGEMRLAGRSPRGDLWRVAVEQPEAGARGIAAALELSDRSIATSGDYRNFLVLDGQRYSHMIDPRSGRPVTHELVSVTVLLNNCMLADAWATAFAVLGLEEALRLAEERALAVYLIAREGDGFATYTSSAFAPYLDVAARPTES